MIPNNFRSILDRVIKYNKLHPSKNINYTESSAASSLFFDISAPLYFVIDYSKNRYVFINSAFDYNMEQGPEHISGIDLEYYTSLWHPCDFKIYKEKIYPNIITFLMQKSTGGHQEYSSTFNYRIKGKPGYYFSILQRSVFIFSQDNDCPSFEVGFIIDISNYKEDSSIIHRVEKIGENNINQSATAFSSSIYYPDNVFWMLSKREIEILKDIYLGMSSKEIAYKYFLSLNTINNHRKNMLQKSGAKNTSDLLRISLKYGIL